MKTVVLVENAKVGMNYSYGEREYMKENNVQVFNSFLQPKGKNSYDLVITVQEN